MVDTVFRYTAVILVLLISGASAPAFGQDYRKMRQGGYYQGHTAEQAGRVAASSAVIRTVRKYIEDRSRATTYGGFNVEDPVLGRIRKLTPVSSPGGPVRHSGGKAYLRAMFRDMDNNEVMDLDFYVEKKGGKLGVSGVKIHSVGGRER